MTLNREEGNRKGSRKPILSDWDVLSSRDDGRSHLPHLQLRLNVCVTQYKHTDLYDVWRNLCLCICVGNSGSLYQLSAYARKQYDGLPARVRDRSFCAWGPPLGLLQFTWIHAWVWMRLSVGTNSVHATTLVVSMYVYVPTKVSLHSRDCRREEQNAVKPLWLNMRPYACDCLNVCLSVHVPFRKWV